MYFRHYGWVVVLAGVFSVTLFGLGEASAKVWMPDGEYREYHDVNGLYTVVGAVKNSESYSVLATVKVTVADGKNTITKEHKMAGPIVKSGERPFKIKFPEVTSQDPEIKAFEITHKKTQYKKPPVEVIYDDTLVLHEDDHITGRVINLGDETVHDYAVHAIARGEDKEFLDAAQNVNKIKEIKPGEVAEFTIYPDPQFKGQVEKYSCFGGGEVGEMMVLARELKQAGEKAVVRYIEGAAYYEPQFNKNGKEFTIVASNAYPFEVDANFEFPINSESEEIDVFFDGKPIDALQSKGEIKGKWHLLFKVPPASEGKLRFTGFEPDTDEVISESSPKSNNDAKSTEEMKTMDIQTADEKKISLKDDGDTSTTKADSYFGLPYLITMPTAIAAASVAIGFSFYKRNKKKVEKQS